MINIPDTIQIASLPLISLNEKYIILTDDYHFNQYRFELNNGIYQYANEIYKPSDSPVNMVTTINSELFLFECLYNFHPDNKQFNTNLAIYNARTNILSNFIHPDLPCIGFSHLEKKWTAVNDSVIALASPCGYQIYLYDLNLKLIDSIQFKPAGWKDIPGLKIPFETNPSKIHPKHLIKKLDNYQDSISRIEKIFFIDDSTLMITGMNGQIPKNRNVELWNIHHHNKPIYTSPVQIVYSDSDLVNPNRELLQLSLPLNLHFNDRKLIWFNDEETFYRDGQSYIQQKQFKDTYYENNDPQFNIGVYKLSIP